MSTGRGFAENKVLSYVNLTRPHGDFLPKKYSMSNEANPSYSEDDSLGVIFESLPVILIKYSDFENIVERYFPNIRYEYCFLTQYSGLKDEAALTARVSLKDDYGCSEELKQWQEGKLEDPPWVWVIVQELLRLGIFRWSFVGASRTDRIEEARFIIEVSW